MKTLRFGFLLIFVVVLNTVVFGQEEVDIKKKEFKRTNQTEGFKEAWKSIKDGDKYYKQGIGTFRMALDHYLFANQYNAFNPELSYKIGICYLYTDEKRKALDFLLKAFELKPSVSPEIRLMIGRAYHYNLEFDEAKKFYLQYKSSLPLDEDIVNLSAKIEKLIIECTHGKDLLENPRRVMLQNIGKNVNSKYDDYNPRFSYGDTALFFTSRRPNEEKKSKRNELDNKFNEDIYISTVSDGEFKEAKLLGKPFYSKGNESIAGIAPDGESVFVYVGSEDGGDIQETYFRQEKGKWKKPKSLSKSIGSDSEETTAALSPNGMELYFVSSNEESTTGGKDIYVTKLNEKGKWGDPRNMGGLINSKYDEEGIFLADQGTTMYFCSRGHNSMGGFDIFKSVKDETGYWGAPQNLGYPVNTPEDEVFYVTDSTGIYGYYSTIREGGFGGKDIYKVVMLGSEKELATLTRDQLIAGTAFDKVDPFITMPKLLEVDTTLLLTGYVRDTVGGADTVVMAALSFIDTDTGMESRKTISGKDGSYKIRLPEAKTYGIEINATGYLYFLDIVDLSGLNTDEAAEKDFYIQRIEVGTKVVLDNIYFETGKSVLAIESYEALDQVVKFLKNNLSVRLEISGHTDNTGSQSVNRRLSEARAKAVVDYIVGKGVERSRLEYKGYADTDPVATNDTREGREMNRRVEFKVLSK